MFSFTRSTQQRVLLWLLALGLLCFAASLFPELRRRLWGAPAPAPAAGEPG